MIQTTLMDTEHLHHRLALAKEELAGAGEARRAVIRAAEEEIRTQQNRIRRANDTYDEIAVPLSREINRLNDQLDAEATPVTVPRQPAPTRAPRVIDTTGIDPEDVEHYLALARKRR